MTFTVSHKNGNRQTDHDTENDAINQVRSVYGNHVFIKEDERDRGRLTVWANEDSSRDVFGAPVACIGLPSDAEAAEPEHAETHHKRKHK